MPYTLKLILEDNTVIESPFIAPNNPKHDMNHPSITDVIYKVGASIVKTDKEVVKCACIAY